MIEEIENPFLRRPASLTASLLLALAILPACQVDRSLPRPGDAERSGRAGLPSSPASQPVGWESHFGERVESGSLDDPASLILIEGERNYRVIEGESDSDTVLIEKAADTDYPFRRHTAGNRIEHLKAGDDGSVILGVVEDLHHKQTTTYDPPMILFPAGLSAGKPVTMESKMTVRPTGNPDQVTDRGACTQTVTLEGIQPVILGSGVVEAYRITTSYEAKLGMARVTQTLTEWYAEEQGLLAQESAEEIRAFIFSSKSSRRMIATD